MRGRNRNKGPNPLTRSYESNGPDVKIRGTAQHIAEKYSQLARDAQASGDPVSAENYLQHAEHYFRIIAAAQEQFREQFGYQNRPFDEESEEEGGFTPERPSFPNGDETDFGSQPQPTFEPRPEPRGSEVREGERQPRFDRGDRNDRGDRRERFPRGDRQRSEHQGDFRRERRREEPTEAAEASSLPAFLTQPVVRPPIGLESEAGEGPAPEAGGAEANGEFRSRRRRRRSRGFGGEEGGAPEGSVGFTPEGAEPAAE
jgi:hypothetical protein